MDAAQKILKETFGYDEFRLNQKTIVESLIAGKDVLALMPTGGGKSICYQIPALVRQGVGIIVSPLIALMQDQVDALNLLGVRAAFINSSLASSQVSQIQQQVDRGQLDLLYVAPERLLMPAFLEFLKRQSLSLIAIDEAHCVSQWGHDFRPDYQQLSVLNQYFPDVPTIALTATADQPTRQEIISALKLKNAVCFVNSFDRPNIRYLISEGHKSRDQLWQFIEQEYPHDAGIVYCLSRKKVEATAEWLQNKGRNALPYHAGLSAQQRRANQQEFLREEGVIVVATIAFGMGIDKPDVRFVAHLSLPKSIEAYYQETGRAGRDGQSSTAWMAYGLQDVILLRQMMQQSDANENYKRISQQKLDAMLGLCESTSCRRQILLSYFGETTEKPCGNCDNCLNPPQTWDATLAARQALSCVFRSGQIFGVGYVIDLLLGKTNDRVIKNRHDQLSTFGIGHEHSMAEWRSLFRQLVAQGYLYVDHEHYGSIKLTEKSRPLLKGEQSLLARKLTKAEKITGSKASKVSTIHQPLMDALKALRKSLADQQGLPPYVIFHDSTLIQMVEKRPSELSEMKYISGVGDRKLQQYGEVFIEVIKAHPLAKTVNAKLSDTVNESLHLFSESKDIAAIAEKRQLTQSTIYNHLAEGIAIGILDLDQLISVSSIQYQQIRQALMAVESKTVGRLKSIKQLLDDEIDYGLIHCVIAAEEGLD